VKLSRMLAGAALVAAFAFSSNAQHLGDVSLSTVSANLATTVNCTGAAQNYITGSVAGFFNIGQIRHLATVSAIIGAQKFQMEIDGIDNQGNVYRLSDVLEFPGLSVTRQGTLIGQGFFPRIQIAVTCSPGTATYTLSYAGDFGIAPTLSGSFLTSQIDHVNFALASSASTQQDNFQTPFANSAGTVYFQFTAGVAGQTLSISCNTLGVSAATSIFSTPLANTTALQTFAVPPTVCPLMQINYSPGGGATTFTTEMVFTPPGLATPGNGIALGTGVDPCVSSAVLKQSQPINIVTATTTTIVPLSTINAIYVCGGYFEVASSATTAATAQFEFGTGANCGTGTTVLTGAMGTGTATAGIDAEAVVLPGPMTNFRAPTGNALCMVTAGTTVNVQGYISYVQQ
jgi:hypothetical protein